MTFPEYIHNRTDASGAGRGRFEGFEVDTDDLRRLARALAQASDTVLHAENAARTGDIRMGNEARPSAARPVPSWLPDYDTSWRALRDTLLQAHRDAVQALRATAHAYLDSDSHAAQLLANAGASDVGSLPLDVVDQLPHPHPADEETRFPDPAEPGGPGGPPTRSGTDIASADLASAIELWRRRRYGTATAAGDLRRALTELRWQGPAAAAFTSWTEDHLRSCAALIDHADIAHTALTSADLAAPDPISPPPPRAGLPTSGVPAQPAESPGPIPPVLHPTNQTNPTPPAAAPAPHPVEEHPAEPHPVQPRPSRDGLDDEQLELADAAPNRAIEAHEAAPVHDQAGNHDATQDAAARHERTAAATVMLLPVAAIAGAALFARTDRAHHIIRDIPLPPFTPEQAAHSVTRAGPAVAAVGAGRSPGPATGPAAHSSSTPTDRAPSDDLDRPRPLQGPLPPGPDASSAVWINLARAEDPPAWIDLAANRGIGLTGPGAADIARTLWRRLHDHHPRALSIVPESLAGHLLAHPGADTPTPGVVVVPDPRQGLTTSWAEVDRRRDVGLHTAPVVLFAPTPVTDTARSDLAATLSRTPHTAFAAVLLGHWDTGTTLTITETHHVSDHHRPAPGLPPLTGTRLHPTTLDTLDTPAPAAPAPDTDDPSVEERLDVPAPPEASIQRTPLALTVLGPVQLRYRRPADDAVEEKVLTVPEMSRPGRELLAYLAAHPGGATRDAVIEALWPDSAADRPDTAFHTTLSRLRKRLRDTTGAPTTAEIIGAVDGRYHLNRDQVTVDYWTFLETHSRNPDHALRRHDHHVAVALYQGPFAADITGEWAHTIREATRRRYLEAIHDLVTIEITDNPDLALELLDRARNLEPLNEAIYRTIIRIHLRHGRHDDARGTYDLLRTHLDIIDAAPDPETEHLVRAVHTGPGPHPG